jgi:uncharacterized repeat protein (TIGR04052 family)
MKLWLLSLGLIISFCQPKKDDTSTRNLLFGLTALSQQTNVNTLNFRSVMDNQELECGTRKYKMPKGQEVFIRDFRLFVEDIQFVRSDGVKVSFQMDNVDKYQIARLGKQLGLLDFTKLGDGACNGTSDDVTTHTSLKGAVPSGVYKQVELTVGVPSNWNHLDPTAEPSSSPLRAGTGLTWNWTTGYKFARFEFNLASDQTKRLVVHIGSTNCTGSAPDVNCANSYRPNLVLEPQGGFDPSKDTIVFVVDELFSEENGGIPESAFGANSSLSCMPIGNGTGTGGTPETCGPILKNLGLNPGAQAGFGSNLVTESGVGTVNPNTRRPILKVLRDLTIDSK